MQYVEGAEVVEQHIEPCDAQNFRRCIVYCFITGDFTLAELESSVAVIAASTGTAPLASAYFRHYDMRVEVRSGGISVAGNAELPSVLHEMARSLSDATYLDAHTHASTKLSWSLWAVLPLIS